MPLGGPRVVLGWFRRSRANSIWSGVVVVVRGVVLGSPVVVLGGLGLFQVAWDWF